MRAFPLTTIASQRIASPSTSTLRAKNAPPENRKASPRTSLTKIWRPPAVAIIQINALRTSATGKSRGEVTMSIFGSIVLLSEIERAFFQRVNVAHHQIVMKLSMLQKITLLCAIASL